MQYCNEACDRRYTLTVILMTKRVVVASGPDEEVLVFSNDHARTPLVARRSVGAPVLTSSQCSHLDAWRQVRAELRDIASPAIATAFVRFMELVEEQREHIYISPRHAAVAVRQRLAVAAPVADNAVADAFRDGTLLVHMIPRLPGAERDAWAYDLGLTMSPTGFEVCSLTLVRSLDTIYACAYGVFAVVPEDETLAIGINDLGVNAFKKQISGKGLDSNSLKAILLEHLQRTHAKDLAAGYDDFARLRAAGRKSPSNEIVVNLKKSHLIGICVNLADLSDKRLLSRLGAKRVLDIARINAEVASIQAAVLRLTGLRLAAWTYDYRYGTLAPLGQLK